MTNEELKTLINNLINPNDLICFNVTNVNFKPHPYTLGPKHISKCPNGLLTEDNIRYMENKKGVHCEHQNCRIPYDQHTSDKIVFIQLKKDIKKEDLQKVLKNIIDKVGEKEFDGFGFVETEEKYRILD